MALPTHYRVVAVPIPRSESAAGQVLGMLDANTDRWFTAEDLGSRLRMDPALVRNALSDLRMRGLARGQPTDKRAGKQPVWIYTAADDLSAHVPAATAGKAAA